jgi:hypothetical protein
MRGRTETGKTQPSARRMITRCRYSGHVSGNLLRGNNKFVAQKIHSKQVNSRVTGGIYEVAVFEDSQVYSNLINIST